MVSTKQCDHFRVWSRFQAFFRGGYGIRRTLGHYVIFEKRNKNNVAGFAHVGVLSIGFFFRPRGVYGIVVDRAYERARANTIDTVFDVGVCMRSGSVH